MKMTIGEVNDEGFEVILDDEAATMLNNLAVAKLGEEASESDKEILIRSLLIEAIDKYSEDKKECE